MLPEYTSYQLRTVEKLKNIFMEVFLLSKEKEQEDPKNTKRKLPGEDRSTLGIVFWGAGGIVALAAVIAVLFPETVETASYSIYDTIARNFNWLFLIDRKSTRLNSSHVSI